MCLRPNSPNDRVHQGARVIHPERGVAWHCYLARFERGRYDRHQSDERPSRVVMPMKRSRDLLFEDACHEGNYSLPNMLRAVRMQEATR